MDQQNLYIIRSVTYDTALRGGHLYEISNFGTTAYRDVDKAMSVLRSHIRAISTNPTFGEYVKFKIDENARTITIQFDYDRLESDYPYDFPAEYNEANEKKYVEITDAFDEYLRHQYGADILWDKYTCEVRLEILDLNVV